MDHEATAIMKAQFMSLWDGLETGPDTQVYTHTHTLYMYMDLSNICFGHVDYL